MRFMLVVLALSCFAATAVAGGDPAAGQQKAETCAACHGPDGNSPTPLYPILADQHPDYLVRALKDYRSGARSNPIMNGFAGALSDADIEDLAAWFASQDSPLHTPSPD